MRHYLIIAAAMLAFNGLHAQVPDTIYTVTAPVTHSLCYTNNMDTLAGYQSADGSPLWMTICSGHMAACCDHAYLFDGPDATAPLIGMNSADESLAGLTFVAYTGTLTLRLESDATVSCETDGFEPLMWIVGLDASSVECQPMGIAVPRASTFNLYPTLANDQVTISVPSSSSGGGLLQLLDLTGRTVVVQQIRSGSTTLGTSNLPAGVYVALLTNEAGSTPRRFEVLH